MRRLVPLPVRFTQADAIRAHDEWGSNCGPGALAAICGLTLDEVRPHMGDFESKGYTNPTLMFESLDRVAKAHGFAWERRSLGTLSVNWPCYGLVRIQWEGPWTAPGVPARVAYRHTHWVGSCWSKPDDIGVFDINCINNGSGWVRLQDWSDQVVPWLLSEEEPKADGKWRITHAIEVRRLTERERRHG